jgi:ribosomal protein S18 acetylase RimI-like enzyme
MGRAGLDLRRLGTTRDSSGWCFLPAADSEFGKSWAVTFPFVTRSGEYADIEQCVAFALIVAPQRSAAEWRDSLLRDLDDPERRLVVAERDGAIIGYGRACFFESEPQAPADTAPDGYYLVGIVVDPDSRRGGVGAALTQARLDWISERANDAWFFANARNIASIELHRRFGFEEVTRHFSFPRARFGGEGILFRLRLRQRTQPSEGRRISAAPCRCAVVESEQEPHHDRVP